MPSFAQSQSHSATIVSIHNRNVIARDTLSLETDIVCCAMVLLHYQKQSSKSIPPGATWVIFSISLPCLQNEPASCLGFPVDSVPQVGLPARNHMWFLVDTHLLNTRVALHCMLIRVQPGTNGLQKLIELFFTNW